MSTLARFGFNVLTISLIFSTIASAVTIDSIGDYWFIIIGAFMVFFISFLTATMLSYIIPIPNQRDFIALRIAATFPNIVALPILIFPSLCEYSVVFEAFGTGDDRAEQYRQCVAKSNTMIFCYFFSWSVLFWSLGHSSLMKAAYMKSPNENNNDENNHNETTNQSQINTTTNNQTAESQSIDLTTPNSEHDNHSIATPEDADTSSSPPLSILERCAAILCNFWAALKHTFSSPPFITMVLAFAVGCISPLRNLFFSQGGYLRFFGAAVETLGQASSPMSTMVVAASLVPRKQDNDTEPSGDTEQATQELSQDLLEDGNQQDSNDATPEESPMMSDPDFGPLHLRRRSSIRQFGTTIKRKSIRALSKVRRTPPEQRRVLLWFTLSRLVLSPLFIVLMIVGLDCGTNIFQSVPDLAKLVLTVNSSVPGALIIVVLLKSQPELNETANVVAKVYFPTYIVSIVSIAAWTALGLIVSIPDENGNDFCSRFQ